MTSDSPIRTVDFCFSREQQLQFHFVDTKSHRAIDEIIAFTRQNDVVIIGLDGFTKEELQALRLTEQDHGRSLFPSPACCANDRCIRRSGCAVFLDTMHECEQA